MPLTFSLEAAPYRRPTGALAAGQIALNRYFGQLCPSIAQNTLFRAFCLKMVLTLKSPAAADALDRNRRGQKPSFAKAQVRSETAIPISQIMMKGILCGFFVEREIKAVQVLAM